jgi:hypothetical protein
MAVDPMAAIAAAVDTAAVDMVAAAAVTITDEFRQSLESRS